MFRKTKVNRQHIHIYIERKELAAMARIAAQIGQGQIECVHQIDSRIKSHLIHIRENARRWYLAMKLLCKKFNFSTFLVANTQL